MTEKIADFSLKQECVAFQKAVCVSTCLAWMCLYAFVCVHVCFCVNEHVLSNSCQNNRAVLVEPADVCQLRERPIVTFLCSCTFLCFLCSFLPPAAASHTLSCLFVCLSSVSFLLSFFHIFISFFHERVWFLHPPCLKHKAQNYRMP